MKKKNFLEFSPQTIFPEIDILDNGSRDGYKLVLTIGYIQRVVRGWQMAVPLFNMDAYGINRKTGSQSPADYDIEEIQNQTKTLFQNEGTPYLLNIENWITSLAAASNFNDKAKIQLEKVKGIINQIFAEAEGLSKEEEIIHFQASDSGNFEVQFKTALGDKVRLTNLGSGYQSLLTWVLDFAYRMFKRYPERPNPIAEPAIVLVDELDLHLHPEWQRRVIGFLRKLFPKTQFIVTAHSPVVIQSADDLNVIVLQKNPETHSVDIMDANDKFNTDTFEGWTLQEILQHLMMEKSEHLYSEKYIGFRKAFEEALEDEHYENAKNAYEQLKQILPDNGDLEVMRMQLQMLDPNHISKRQKYTDKL